MTNNWFNILKNLDIPEDHAKAQERDALMDYLHQGDISSTNTTGGHDDDGDCCKQLVHDYFFNTPDDPYEKGPYRRANGEIEHFDPQECYDFWTEHPDRCLKFVDTIKKSGLDPINNYHSWITHRKKILAEYDSCIGSNDIDSSGWK